MGFFDGVMEGLFGSDDGSDMVGDIIDKGVEWGDTLFPQSQEGFNIANLLMPVLLGELGITPTMDKDGNITGFGREESPADKLRGKLEMTTLQNLQKFYEGKGELPIGLRNRSKAQTQNFKAAMRKSGFSRGDSPFEAGLSGLRGQIMETNDAFRHGQFANAAGLMNSIDANQRADLSTLLTGAMGAQQSPLPWLQMGGNLMGNLGGLAGGAGQIQGKPGLVGTALGAWAGAGFPGMCWVARAVYGEDNPDWLRFRFWLTARAPLWLGTVYRKYGKRVAAFIHHCPVVGKMLRPFMDMVI